MHYAHDRGASLKKVKGVQAPYRVCIQVQMPVDP
jgi:hypothetical protein